MNSCPGDQVYLKIKMNPSFSFPVVRFLTIKILLVRFQVKKLFFFENVSAFLVVCVVRRPSSVVRSSIVLGKKIESCGGVEQFTI